LGVLREKERRPCGPGSRGAFFVAEPFLRASRQGSVVFHLRSNFAHRLTSILGVCLLVTTNVMGKAAEQATSSSIAPAMHEVVDGAGRTIRIPVSPARIISLAPSLTETVYALGLQDRLVGDTDYCDYPPDAQKKQKVGGAINPSLEQIAALHPDLVLVTKDFNRLETVRALETLGIPSYAIDPHTVADILSSTEKLADVLGAPDAGKALESELRQRLSALQTKLAGIPPRRVLFIVWTEPLISIGKQTFIADALREAGAVSIVDSQQNWPQMNMEEVVRLQPDYLVFAAAHFASGEHDFDVLATQPGWDILQAVQNRRYAVISDAVNRPAPRIVSAIEELARQLHPEAFQAAPPPQKDAPASKPETTDRTDSSYPSAPFVATPSSPAQEFSCAR
jgi:iron complex transport system substrate-binding protein